MQSFAMIAGKTFIVPLKSMHAIRIAKFNTFAKNVTTTITQMEDAPNEDLQRLAEQPYP